MLQTQKVSNRSFEITNTSANSFFYQSLFSSDQKIKRKTKDHLYVH